MELGLKGKVALVVAASKGMGKACAMGLAAEGARVAMCARGEADLTRRPPRSRQATGAEVLAIPADANKPEDIERVVSARRAEVGRRRRARGQCGWAAPGPFEQMTDEHWLAAFEQVHLSTVRFIRAVLPDMKKKKWGRILAIQSSSVKQPVEGLILSNGIRPGIAGMFKTLAGDLAKDGITVNLVLPGRIQDGPLSRAPDGPGQAPGLDARGADRRPLGADIPRAGWARRRSSRAWWSSSPPSAHRT